MRWLMLTVTSVTLAACAADAPQTPTDSTEPQESSISLAAAAGSWRSRAPMPTPRYELAAALVPNASGQQVLYAIGGWEGSAGSLAPSNRVEAYNTHTNTWVRRKSVPAKRAGLRGAGVIGGEIYVVGGTGSGALGPFSTKTLYIYSPSRNAWRRGADLPVRDALRLTGVTAPLWTIVTGGRLDNGPGAEPPFVVLGSTELFIP